MTETVSISSDISSNLVLKSKIALPSFVRSYEFDADAFLKICSGSDAIDQDAFKDSVQEGILEQDFGYKGQVFELTSPSTFYSFQESFFANGSSYLDLGPKDFFLLTRAAKHLFPETFWVILLNKKPITGKNGKDFYVLITKRIAKDFSFGFLPLVGQSKIILKKSNFLLVTK